MRFSEASVPDKQSPPAWQGAFLAMLPAIETHAKRAFRHLRSEARHEAVRQVVCYACAAVARLVALNKVVLARPGAVARFGAAQTTDGRKVGGRLRIRDGASPSCQPESGSTVAHLDRFDKAEDAWREVPMEDRHTGPVEVAAIDPATVLKGEDQ
jgi:hypothetical protein